MLKTIIKIITFGSLFISFLFLFQTCGDDATGLSPSYMAGNITYNDNSTSYSGGYYCVSFYSPDSTDPFHRAPIKSDSLSLNLSEGVTKAFYKESSLPTGSYYIASTWIYPGYKTFVLGIYGCDTVQGTPTKVDFPNYAGTGALDFRSKTNPAHAIFVYP